MFIEQDGRKFGCPFLEFCSFKDGSSFIPCKRWECVRPTDKGDLGVLPISTKTLSFRNGPIINQHQTGLVECPNCILHDWC